MKKEREAFPQKGEQTEETDHPGDGLSERICDPLGGVFSDSESRTAPKSAQENPVSVSADEKILKVQSNAATKNANPRRQIGNIIYKKL